MEIPAPLASELVAEGPLGKGAFGEVLAVRHRRDGTRYALKLIPVGGDGARERRELEAALRVRHENVIRGYAGGVADGVAYLLLELADGSIEPWLSDPAHRSEAWEALRQTARGLAAIHRAGLVHRDLKPSNVLLKQGVAKVSDLGLTKGGDLSTLTQVGMVLGTPGFLSPEQARGERLGPASDAFPLGVMFYQLLEGRLPYREREPIELVRAAALGRLDPWLVAPRCLAPGTLAAVSALLALDPGKRPADLERFADELGPFAPVVDPDRLRSTMAMTEPEPVAAASTRPTLMAARVATASVGPRARSRSWVALLVAGVLAIGLLLRWRRAAAPEGIAWEAVGDVVSVRFSGVDPQAVFLEIDGVRVPVMVEGGGKAGSRVLARGLAEAPARRVVLGWPGGRTPEVEIHSEPPAVLPRARLAAGRKLRIEVVRPCRVRFRGTGPDEVALEPGVQVLSPPPGEGVFRLEWEESGLAFAQEFRLDDLVEEAVARLAGATDVASVQDATSARLRSLFSEPYGRRSRPADEAEDPMASDRAAWRDLVGWIPEALGSGASVATRRRLHRLREEWAIYTALDSAVSGREDELALGPGEFGAAQAGLPDFVVRARHPVVLTPSGAAAGPAAEAPIDGIHRIGVVRQGFLALRSREPHRTLGFAWPMLEAPARARVVLAVKAALGSFFVLRVRSLDPAEEFSVVLRNVTPALARDGDDGNEGDDGDDDGPGAAAGDSPVPGGQLLRRRVEHWTATGPTWFSLVLPRDLWPTPGTAMELDCEPFAGPWPATARVEAVEILVEETG